MVLHIWIVFKEEKSIVNNNDNLTLEIAESSSSSLTLTGNMEELVIDILSVVGVLRLEELVILNLYYSNY